MQRLRDTKVQGTQRHKDIIKTLESAKIQEHVKIQKHKNSMMNRKRVASTLKQKGSLDAQTLICRDPWAHRDREI